MPKSLTKADRDALDLIRKREGVWSITAAPELFESALRLKKAGLVCFEPRQDGKGRPNGHTIVLATPSAAPAPKAKVEGRTQLVGYATRHALTRTASEARIMALETLRSLVETHRRNHGNL